MTTEDFDPLGGDGVARGLLSAPAFFVRPSTHKARLARSGWSLSALPPEADIRQRIEHVCFCARSGRQRRSGSKPTARSPDPNAGFSALGFRDSLSYSADTGLLRKSTRF